MCDGNCSPDLPDPVRRDLLARAGLAAVAGLLLNSCGALADLFAPGTGTTLSGPLTINVADYPALANVGGVALLTNVPAPLAAVRATTTTFAVFSRRCPHQGTTIGLNGTGFRCPNHGALFDRQGNNTGGFRAGSLQSVASTYDQATNVLTIG